MSQHLHFCRRARQTLRRAKSDHPEALTRIVILKGAKVYTSDIFEEWASLAGAAVRVTRPGGKTLHGIVGEATSDSTVAWVLTREEGRKMIQKASGDLVHMIRPPFQTVGTLVDTLDAPWVPSCDSTVDALLVAEVLHRPDREYPEGSSNTVNNAAAVSPLGECPPDCHYCLGPETD